MHPANILYKLYATHYHAHKIYKDIFLRAACRIVPNTCRPPDGLSWSTYPSTLKPISRADWQDLCNVPPARSAIRARERAAARRTCSILFRPPAPHRGNICPFDAADRKEKDRDTNFRPAGIHRIDRRQPAAAQLAVWICSGQRRSGSTPSR